MTNLLTACTSASSQHARKQNPHLRMCRLQAINAATCCQIRYVHCQAQKALSPCMQLLSLKNLYNCRRRSFQTIMFTYAGICGLWIPLNFWMMPWRPIAIGQVCWPNSLSCDGPYSALLMLQSEGWLCVSQTAQTIMLCLRYMYYF